METDTLRRAAHIHATHCLVATLLPLAPREIPKIEQNRAVRGEGSVHLIEVLAWQAFEHNLDRTGCSVRFTIHPCRASSDVLASTIPLFGERHEPPQTY
jgi:hypothetical protein